MKALRYLWMVAAATLIVAGCSTKVDPYRRQGDSSGQQAPGQQQGDQPSTQPKEVKPTENKNWSVKYAGRKQVKGDLVEVIEVNSVPASQKYLVSVINRENYKFYTDEYDTFEKAIMAFMETELENTAQEYVYQGGSPQVIYFDPFRHGTWFAFVIGVDNNQKLTGEYAYLRFTVEEDEPSEAFSRWLGQWTVSDGRISYDITVSSAESNFVYRVDGWETGKDMDEEMNQEYLETFFESADGNMYFVSQYIQSYPEDQNNDNSPVLDEFFMGQVDYDDIYEQMGLYIITTEGIDLACATFDEEGDASIVPCQVETTIGNSSYKGVFYNMQYFFLDNGMWFTYNDNTARLPMTMVRKGAAPQARSIRSRGVVRQKALRGKVHVPRDERKALAVRR